MTVTFTLPVERILTIRLVTGEPQLDTMLPKNKTASASRYQRCSNFSDLVFFLLALRSFSFKVCVSVCAQRWPDESDNNRKTLPVARIIPYLCTSMSIVKLSECNSRDWIESTISFKVGTGHRGWLHLKAFLNCHRCQRFLYTNYMEMFWEHAYLVHRRRSFISFYVPHTSWRREMTLHLGGPASQKAGEISTLIK